MPSKPLEPIGKYKLFWAILAIVSFSVFLFSAPKDFAFLGGVGPWLAENFPNRDGPPIQKFQCDEGYQPFRGHVTRTMIGGNVYNATYEIPARCKTRMLTLPTDTRRFEFVSQQELVVTAKLASGETKEWIYLPTDPRGVQQNQWITGLQFTNDFDGPLHVRIAASYN